MKENARDWRSAVTRTGVALLLVAGLVGTLPRGVLGQQAGYGFRPLAFLEDPAPGGGSFTYDFEPYGINNLGEVAFVADLTTGGEGVFLARKGRISEIMRSGQPAPGGGTFEGATWGHSALNAQGDVAFVFKLSPVGSPDGVNAGLYRYLHGTKKLDAVMVPEVTPAPGGGVFKGAFQHASLNSRREIVFTGVVPTDKGLHRPGQEYLGLGWGIFRANRRGRISSVVSPGDPVPGGSTFDSAGDPWINERGDAAFEAHVTGEKCGDLQDICPNSVYLWKAATGKIQSIAHQGNPAPGGGVYLNAWGPVLNNRGEVVFIGDLPPTAPAEGIRGVFLSSGETVIAVARPGDPMPAGGKLKNVSVFISNYHLNNRGEVSFNAILDSDEDGDGLDDTGLYVWSRGSLRLVARTGTVIPGVGTVAHLSSPSLAGFSGGPTSGAILNDRGEVFFQATLTDGRGVLLVATPRKGRR